MLFPAFRKVPNSAFDQDLIRLCMQMPHPFIESCYKGMYLTYVRYCKFTNPNVHQGQLFMAQCVVELFGIDLNVAYEVCSKICNAGVP